MLLIFTLIYINGSQLLVASDEMNLRPGRVVGHGEVVGDRGGGGGTVVGGD